MGAIATLLAFGLVLLRASTFAVPSTDNNPVQKPGNSKTQLDIILEATGEIKTQLNGMHETTEEIKKEIDGMHETTGEIKTQLDDMHETTEDIKTQVDSMQSEIKLLHLEFRRMKAFAVSNCPPGFVYLPESESCYQVVSDALRNWTTASQKCQGLYDGAHLAVITNECENKAVKSFLRSEISKNPYINCRDPEYTVQGNQFWIGGQRINANNCSTEFVWKLPGEVPQYMKFTDWLSGEPNCAYKNGEGCLIVWPDRQYLWNDRSCDAKICAVCEYNPPLHNSCL